MDINRVPHPVALARGDRIVSVNDSFLKEFGACRDLKQLERLGDFFLISLGELTLAVPSDCVQRKTKDARLAKLVTILVAAFRRAGDDENFLDIVCEELGKSGIFDCVFTQTLRHFMKCSKCDGSCNYEKIEVPGGRFLVIGSEIGATVRDILDVFFLGYEVRKLEKDKIRLVKTVTENLEHFELLSDRLRNPLAIIKGFLEVRDEVSNGYVFGVIEEQVKRIERILNSMNEAEENTYDLVKEYDR